MLQNNGARLNIWKELTNPYDYQTFVGKCAEKQIVPMNQVDYAQKVGMLLAAKSLYPNLEIEQAYVMFVQENMGVGSVQPSGITKVVPNGNTIYKESNDVSSDLIAQLTGQKSCCGGGKVL
jgi:hypothetical protein